MKSQSFSSPLRTRIVLTGVVQGVGYRPLVHRLAEELGLAGCVFNSSRGLVVEVEGGRKRVAVFCRRLLEERPPLAVIRGKKISRLPFRGYRRFTIRSSRREERGFTLVSPDVSVCPECLTELFDVRDRRFRYPFINCTNCGPRFSIIRATPYDRPSTTMAGFRLCPDCRREYEDIASRRYHCQPDACPVCGPRIELLDRNPRPPATADPFQKVGALLRRGKIVAVKGIGGIHLLADAASDAAVARIRRLKQRERKPLALMAVSPEAIKRICRVGREEEKLLTSPPRPIVLLKKKETGGVSELVAPGNICLGVMLPYSPLHYLLLEEAGLPAVVATSANVADEPIAVEPEEIPAFVRRGCGLILTHNRPIHNRCDDSVAAVVNRRPFLLRRSRGYAPLSLPIPGKNHQVLATGAEEKNTVCLTRDGWAYLSQHLGDLKGEKAFAFFRETVERMKKIFRIEPRLVVHDLHPEYLGSRYARALKLPRLGVQHHHAHIAACLAENGLDRKVIGIAFDGTGLGTDGRVWGGEFLVADLSGFERRAHLEYLPLPGGDQAVSEPARTAVSCLYAAFGEEIFDLRLDFLRRVGKRKLKILVGMIRHRVNSPLSSGCGRLFDAVSALAGICDKISYEAQGPIELEAVSEPGARSHYPFRLEKEGDAIVVRIAPIFRALARDLERKVPAGRIGGKFHNTVTEFSVEISRMIRRERKINEVALSGGVFQNRLLLEKMTARFTGAGFRVYTHSRVPPNDGGISFGQAAIGLRYLACFR